MILIYMQCRVLRGWGYAARMIFSSCLWETAEDIFRYLACSSELSCEQNFEIWKILLITALVVYR